MPERDQPKKTEDTLESAAAEEFRMVYCPEHKWVVGVFQPASGQYICPEEHNPSWSGSPDVKRRKHG